MLGDARPPSAQTIELTLPRRLRALLGVIGVEVPVGTFDIINGGVDANATVAADDEMMYE